MLLSLSGEIVGRAVTHEDNLRLLCQAIEKLKTEQADPPQDEVLPKAGQTR